MRDTSNLKDDAGLITIREAASTYGVSERTIRRWLGDGRLTRYKRGGDRMVRVRRDEVGRLRDWRKA